MAHTVGGAGVLGQGFWGRFGARGKGFGADLGQGFGAQIWGRGFEADLGKGFGAQIWGRGFGADLGQGFGGIANGGPQVGPRGRLERIFFGPQNRV